MPVYESMTGKNDNISHELHRVRVEDFTKQ